tara:strand:+ start:1272 stop:2045 length:774 start_codon:yes stop_codon:yes gene_type:complete
MQNSPIIEIQDLNYLIDDKKIINDISFNVNEGDFISILGPNGSGKSTLIKLISGDIKASSGNIKILGKNKHDWDIEELANYRSVLPQFDNLSFPFRVLDVIKMGRYPVLEKHDDNIIYEELLNIFDLSNLSTQIYTTLSGGEKQRVQLARVVSQIWTNESYKKKILLLDEPTSFLDIKHQLLMFKFLKKLHKKGLTIVMVLHDINQAILNSDKILLLKDTALIAYDQKDEIINNGLLNEVFDVCFDIENIKKNIISV